MSDNATEKRDAIKILLKRYDLINAWKYVVPAWLADVVFSVVFSVFILWILLSIVAFSPEEYLFTDAEPNKIKFYFLYYFSHYALYLLLGLCLFIFVIRLLSRQIRKKRPAIALESETQLNKVSQLIHKFPAKFLRLKEIGIFTILGLIMLIAVGTKAFFLYCIMVIAFVILPSLFKVFVFSVFLPRVIITISYVWITFIFTEENTRYFEALDRFVYALIFIMGLFGSAFFLFHEAYQNAPSIKRSDALIKRVLPVLAYAIFISAGLGFIIEYATKDTSLVKEKHAATPEANILTDSLAVENKRHLIFNSLNSILDQIQNERNNLNSIDIVAQLQKTAPSTNYSNAYNMKLEQIKESFTNFAETLFLSLSQDTVINKKDTSVVHECEKHRALNCRDNFEALFEGTSTIRYIDSIHNIKTVYSSNNDSLDAQIYIAQNNDTIMSWIILHAQSIINYHVTEALNRINWYTDKSYLQSKKKGETGYALYENKDTLQLDSLHKIFTKNSVWKNDCYLTYYPVKYKYFNATVKSKKEPDSTAQNSSNNQYLNQDDTLNPYVPINLKRFLIQVIIAVAIGVIGQLIIADKTVTEPL